MELQTLQKKGKSVRKKTKKVFLFRLMEVLNENEGKSGRLPFFSNGWL